MTYFNITNIAILNNPAPFLANIKLQVQFQCLIDVKQELVWEIVYIGSVKSDQYDQVLETFSMGPISKGIMEFQMECAAPDYKKIPSLQDLLGVTAMIISVYHDKREIFRVGYYVYNFGAENKNNSEQSSFEISKITRSILVEQPRISRFNYDEEKSTSNSNMTESCGDESKTQELISSQSIDEFAYQDQHISSIQEQFSQNSQKLTPSQIISDSNAATSFDNISQSILSYSNSFQFEGPPNSENSINQERVLSKVVDFRLVKNNNNDKISSDDPLYNKYTESNFCFPFQSYSLSRTWETNINSMDMQENFN